MRLGTSTFTAEVDEADIDRVKLGMTADVTLDAFPGETFKTTVVHINPAAQPTATGGTIFQVELAHDRHRQDDPARHEGRRDDPGLGGQGALTIPVEALFNQNGQNFVYKVVNDKLVKTNITVGATTDTDVEVLSGLSGRRRRRAGRGRLSTRTAWPSGAELAGGAHDRSRDGDHVPTEAEPQAPLAVEPVTSCLRRATSRRATSSTTSWSMRSAA